tara:strand:- start:207 stop:1028 length:822 start_codon:yes stop_codon:yes gene_type:complete
LKDPFFNKLNYQDHILKYPFNKELLEDVDLNQIDKKLVRPTYESVDEYNKVPFSSEYDDLIRLHYLVLSRKVTTVLEFGVGKSSIVFDNALRINKVLYEDFCKKNLRRGNLFECHSIDNNEDWINSVKKKYNTELVTISYSDCIVSEFNNRICTLYENIPNICPDLIYLDAPDQFSPKGNVRGISTNHTDRLPMSGDILCFENFLLPGTLIVVDGRTANAIFLKNNLQRDWKYYYSEIYDQHFFELNEKPLGPYNKRQLDFCLKETDVKMYEF